MTNTGVPAAWRQGEVLSWVAPGALPPRVFAEALEAGGVLVVVPTDSMALLWAAGTGAGLLLSSTSRVARERLVGRGSRNAGVVVTSVDSLHSEILRADLAARLPGVPWCVWWADRFSPLHRGHGARKEWVDRYRRECGGGGLLWVYADARSDEGLEQPLAGSDRPGFVLSLADGPALAEVFAHFGGGVVAASILPSGMGPGLQGEGLPLRSHGGSRSPGEEEALARLQEGLRGVDHLIGPGADAGPVFGRVTALSASDLMPADLVVPPGTGLAVLATPDSGDAPCDEAAVARCLARLEQAAVADGFAVPGDDLDAPGGLLEDLAALGWLSELRGASMSAVVSDQHRLRPPFTDRHPAFAAFQQAYSDAQSSWSLREQAELALTDRAPQDLRKLAASLGRSTVDLAMLLRALDQESVVTARLRSLGGARDWEARRGPRFDDGPAAAAEAIQELRARRDALRGEAAALLDGTESVLANGAWRAGSFSEVGLGEQARLPGRAGTTSKPVELPPSLRGSGNPARTGAEGLFSGLAARPLPPAEVKRELPWTPQRAAEALNSGEAEKIASAVEALGGAAALLACATHDHRAPGRPPAPPDAAAVDDLLEALILESSPAGLPARLPSGSAARRTNRGRLEVDLADGPRRGVHRFEPRVPAALAVAWAEALGDSDERITRWRATRRSFELWASFAKAVEQRVVEASQAEDPEAALLSAPPTLGHEPGEASSVWAELFEAVAAAVSGDIDAALARTAALDRADLRTVEAFWLGASGRWPVLAEEAAAASGRKGRGEAPSPRAALATRALPLCEPVPELDAAGLVAWLGKVPGGVVSSGSLDRLVAAVRTGRPRDFSDLAARADARGLSTVPVARRAMELGVLPSGLARVLLDAAGGEADAALLADLLRATTGRPSRAATAWQALLGQPGEAAEEAVLPLLAAADDPLDAALLAVGERRRLRREEVAAQRERIVRLDQEGHSEEAARALSTLSAADRRALATGPEDLQATREAALARLNRFGSVLARVLASSALPDAERVPVEQEARDALDDAAKEGWLELVLQALRAQQRRHPDDPHRARWLAQALGRAGRWGEAEQAWDLALQVSAPADARELGIEATDAYLRARQDKRALRAIERLVAGPPDRVAGNRLAAWADEGLLQGKTAGRVTQILRQTRSGVYAAAIRLLG